MLGTPHACLVLLIHAWYHCMIHPSWWPVTGCHALSTDDVSGTAGSKAGPTLDLPHPQKLPEKEGKGIHNPAWEQGLTANFSLFKLVQC